MNIAILYLMLGLAHWAEHLKTSRRLRRNCHRIIFTIYLVMGCLHGFQGE